MLPTREDLYVMESEKGAHVTFSAAIGTFSVRQIAGKRCEGPGILLIDKKLFMIEAGNTTFGHVSKDNLSI